MLHLYYRPQQKSQQEIYADFVYLDQYQQVVECQVDNMTITVPLEMVTCIFPRS